MDKWKDKPNPTDAELTQIRWKERAQIHVINSQKFRGILNKRKIRRSTIWIGYGLYDDDDDDVRTLEEEEEEEEEEEGTRRI